VIHQFYAERLRSNGQQASRRPQREAQGEPTIGDSDLISFLNESNGFWLHGHKGKK
jgi:hypothetical protein